MKLLAVRHGQASFEAADYDQLSPLGEQQARALGQWLLRHDQRFDCVVSGGLRRHAQTLQAIEAVYREAGCPLPSCQINPAFDEFDHRQVMASFLQLRPEHPSVLAADGGRSREHAKLLALLRHALQDWARGELDSLLNEPWSVFKQRTRTAAVELARSLRGNSVLLISSGGVIAQIAAAALEAPDSRAVELNLTLRNCALSELQADEHGLRLDSWNAIPHLADQRSLWTYV